MFRYIVLMFFGLLLAAADCGLKPIKPIIPIGCKDLAPVCVCDETGKKCKWQWVCVK